MLRLQTSDIRLKLLGRLKANYTAQEFLYNAICADLSESIHKGARNCNTVSYLVQSVYSGFRLQFMLHVLVLSLKKNVYAPCSLIEGNTTLSLLHAQCIHSQLRHARAQTIQIFVLDGVVINSCKTRSVSGSNTRSRTFHSTVVCGDVISSCTMHYPSCFVLPCSVAVHLYASNSHANLDCKMKNFSLMAPMVRGKMTQL